MACLEKGTKKPLLAFDPYCLQGNVPPNSVRRRGVEWRGGLAGACGHQLQLVDQKAGEI